MLKHRKGGEEGAVERNHFVLTLTPYASLLGRGVGRGVWSEV